MIIRPIPVALAILLCPALNAQNVIWSDDFSNPSTWVIGHDGPVALDWQIGVGLQNMGQYAIAPIQSTTAANGYAMLDSDGFNNQTADEEQSHITTALPLDLSGAAAVRLRF